MSIRWMVAQLSPWIEFAEGYLTHEYEQTNLYLESIGQRMSEWAHGMEYFIISCWSSANKLGRLHNSVQGIVRLFGSFPRTPGNYKIMDTTTGKPTTTPLLSTNERIHPSVRVRYGHGPGMENRGLYNPPALKGWNVTTNNHKGEDQEAAESTTDFEWKYTGLNKLHTTKLPEELLSPLEMILLKRHTEQVVKYQTNQ
jgi:hypothetical protein